MGDPKNPMTFSDCLRLRTMPVAVRQSTFELCEHTLGLAASTARWRIPQILILLSVACVLWCKPSPFNTGIARAESLSTEVSANSVSAPVSSAKDEAAFRAAMAIDPGAEAPVSNLVDALARAGRKRDALVEADQFIERRTATAALRAQRGFLRRELNNTHGASEDFVAALAGEGLTVDQRVNVQAGLAEAQAAESQGELDRAQIDLAQGKFVQAASGAQLVLVSNPKSEMAMHIRVAALTAAGRKQEALADADQFVLGGESAPLLLAQRGFLRRELHNTAGAIEDFAAALSGDGLSAEQRHNVEGALAEAQSAERQAASNNAKSILQRDRYSDAATRIRIDALSRAGRKHEAQGEIDRLISSGHAPGWLYAQRGFARRNTEDFQGAVQDFDAALARGDLDRRSAPNIRYARAEAAAMLAEHDGQPQKAEASYREFLQTEPEQADGWFKLGYLLLQQKRWPQGADALFKGLRLRPVGTAYLDAANAYIFANAPLASKLYREGLDRWYAGDPSLAGRSGSDVERIKNEVVEADATIRTTMSFGGIGARPEASGGNNIAGGVETRMRFDDRYLPAVQGLEAITRGLTDKDANGVRETDAALGMRYRPIQDLNLYFGGAVDHFFQPRSETEFVLNWGLGLGADAYPYFTGWKAYWDLGTFGSWRTADQRVLEDTRANAGFLYAFRTPIRGAVGPTILAVAGYDNQAATPWAAGVGPSMLSYFWLGGDKYRSYDSILSLQFGYLFNIGNDARQRGWRGQIGITF